MQFGIVSSLISLGGLTIVMGLWMLAASYTRDEANAEELRIWGLSCLVFGIAYPLFAGRSTLPLFWSLVVGNTFFALGFAGFGLAIAHLFERKFPARVVIASILLCAGALYYFEVVRGDSSWRIVILAAITIVPWVVSGTQCCREWRAKPSPHILAMSIAFLAMILVSLWRLVLAAAQGDFGYSGMPTNPGQILGTHILLISPVLLTVGFFLLSSERTQAVIKRLADTDPLTGIFNRRSVILLAENRMASAQRRQQAFSCVAFDLDGLKKINDAHGHAAGDLALVHLTDVVSQLVRAEDVFGRLGGDEFAVFMPYSDRRGAAVLAERFRTALSKRPLAFKNGEVVVTASFGVASLHESDSSPLDLLHRADRALYDAKKGGGNLVMERSEPPV